MVEIAPGISVDPAVRFGRPVIHGTRVPAATIVARIASGMTFAEIIEEYEIKEEDIYNALNYAAQRLSEEQIWVMI